MQVKTESTIKKIFIGVSIAVISAVIISFLNLDKLKKHHQTNSSEVKIKNEQHNFTKSNKPKENIENFKVDKKNQNWVGEYHQVGYAKPYPIILKIESLDSFSIQGKLNWRSLNNSVTSFRGNIVKRPVQDFVEQAKWNIVDEYVNVKGGKWIKFEEIKIISGKGIDLNGSYYCNMLPNGEIRGHWFKNGTSNSGGKFILTKR